MTDDVWMLPCESPEVADEEDSLTRTSENDFRLLVLVVGRGDALSDACEPSKAEVVPPRKRGTRKLVRNGISDIIDR